MTIRAKLYTAIVVVVAGLALTAGVGISVTASTTCSARPMRGRSRCS